MAEQRGAVHDYSHAMRVRLPQLPQTNSKNMINLTPPTTSKVCVKCGKQKPATEFYKHPTNADGLQAYCKECQSAASREIYLRTKGKPAAVAGNPELAGVTDREVQERIKALLNELRARGWQAECKIAYLHTKTL